MASSARIASMALEVSVETRHFVAARELVLKLQRRLGKN
jgi:hypothetical protein